MVRVTAASNRREPRGAIELTFLIADREDEWQEIVGESPEIGTD